MIAALFVMADGPYAGRPDVDLWDEARDARLYTGPHPVVAHPPCQRWGRWWWKGPNGTRYTRPGMDGGLFEAALAMVHRHGGVLEHPAGSLAWPAFNLPVPPAIGRWVHYPPSFLPRPPGWSCHVEQGRYGHPAPKPTWLYYVGSAAPTPLIWGPSASVYHSAEERRAAKQARGRNRDSPVERATKRERKITPPAFCEELLRLARHSAAGRQVDQIKQTGRIP